MCDEIAKSIAESCANFVLTPELQSFTTLDEDDLAAASTLLSELRLSAAIAEAEERSLYTSHVVGPWCTQVRQFEPPAFHATMPVQTEYELVPAPLPPSSLPYVDMPRPRWSSTSTHHSFVSHSFDTFPPTPISSNYADSPQSSPTERDPTKKQMKAFMKLPQFCSYCKNNCRVARETNLGGPPLANIEAEEALWQSHRLKNVFGEVVCPRLAAHKCVHCGATGKDAHTERYCSHKPLFEQRRHSYRY